jgi:hypothetical protein
MIKIINRYLLYLKESFKRQAEDIFYNKNVIKYTAIALVGINLSGIAHLVASKSRGYYATGGEICFVFIPLLWWIIEKTVKGMRKHIK